MDSPEEQAGTTAPRTDIAPENGGSGAHATAPAAPEMVEPRTETLPVPAAAGGRRTPPPPPPSGGGGGGDDEEDGMLRMSFLEHLEELRSRLIRMVMGIGVAFVLSLTFTD